VQENDGWWEIVPDDPNDSQAFSDLVVSASDEMSAKVYENVDDQWVTQLQDLTTGLEGTMTAGANWDVTNIATGEVIGSIGAAAPYLYDGITSADWIIEDPEEFSATPGNLLFPFPNFGTASFSNVEVNSASPTITAQDAFEIVNQSGQALTLEAPVANGGFNETYAGS
jgi:hypothetical protein